MRLPVWQRIFGNRRAPTEPRRAPTRATFRPGVESLEDLVLLSGMTFLPAHLLSGAPLASQQGAPAGLSPAQVRHAYGFDQITFAGGTVAGNGAGQTIAIVDAYDDPSIAADLAVFDQQFGLAAPPSFVKVGINASGGASTTQFPAADPGWAGEIELDVEWAHAIAPGANILLVEAHSASDTDLLNAVDYARQQPGVVAVSMSWGAGEFSGEQSLDAHFATPAGHAGVTFFGSSGDNGSPSIWPALSTHVVGVGGTTLSVDASGKYLGETGWNGSGGSLSAFLAQPGYQAGLTIHSGAAAVSSGGKRVGPVVAFDADPRSGVAVYGTYGWGGWAQVGGTSAAAPQWAALMAITDQGRALAGLGSLDGYTQALPALYQLPAGDFHDVTSGGNGGYQAGAGFDLVTGRGSPVANLVVRDLVGGAGTGSGSAKPPSVATAAHVVSQTPTTAALAVLGADAAGEASLTYTWKVVGTAPGSVAFSANGSNAAKNTTVTFGAAGTYTFQVTVTDAAGLTVTSQVSVTVKAVLTSVVVTPGTATVAPGQKQQFSAAAKDQFGNALASQPAFTWSLAPGSTGAVNSAGLFTAGGATGSAVVRATAGGATGTAAVSIAGGTVLFRDPNVYPVSAPPGVTFIAVAAGQPSWANYSAQMTVNVQSTSRGEAGLLARAKDFLHGYFFGYDFAQGAWVIGKLNGSPMPATVAKVAAGLKMGQDYVVQASLSGNTLQLYVNGVLTLQTTDSTYAAGTIGFTVASGAASFGNVTVTQLPTASVSGSAYGAVASILSQANKQPGPGGLGWL